MTRLYQPNTIGSVAESADEYTKRLSFSILRTDYYHKEPTLHNCMYYRKKHSLLKRHSRNTGFKTLLDYIPEKATVCRTLKNSRRRLRKIIL